MSEQQHQARCSENRFQLSPLLAGFEFDRWLNTPGWPPYLPDLSPGEQLMKPAEELAELWAADGLNVEAIEAVDIAAWRTYQLVYFLDQVLQKSPLPEGEGQVTSWGSGPASWSGTWGHTGPWPSAHPLCGPAMQVLGSGRD